MNEPRDVVRQMYHGTLVDGGPPAIVFAFAALAALLVGLVAPAAGLAILALGVLAAMIISFVELRPTAEIKPSGSRSKASGTGS
jgi:hypothetical protein